MFGDKVYDVLKTVSLIFVPLSAFVSTILGIFEVAQTEKITAVLAAIDTLLGCLVTVAKIKYDEKKEKELEEAKKLNAQGEI